MKKGSLIVCFLLLIPAAALAQEKTLYDISEDMFVLVEAYNACAARDIACSEDDALALQADAKNSLRDLAMLIRSGSIQRMIITPVQARILSDRANSVRGRLVHIELFDALCNRAVILMASTLYYIGRDLEGIVFIFGLMIHGHGFIGGLVIELVLITILFINMAVVLGAFVLMPSCLFWWL